MKPRLEPVLKLAAGHPSDLLVLRVHGSLERAQLDDFFRRLAFESSGARALVLDMSGVDSFGHAAFDRFCALARDMDLRGRRLALAALPPLLYRHQIRTAICGDGALAFHETVEAAVEVAAASR